MNQALPAAHTPVERNAARLKAWQLFRRARGNPNRQPTISTAVLTLERQR
jgi:hypothetical protein